MDEDAQRTTTAGGERASAFDEALRRLGRRPYAAAELRGWLLERGHDDEAVSQALERCVERRWIDDAALARDYIVARAARIGYGPNRLVGELVRRGVDESTALAAWRGAFDAGEVDLEAMLARRVRRRLAGRGRLAPRALARVYTALLREGFERDDVERALRPHAARSTATGPSGSRDVDDGSAIDGQHDDFA